MLARNDGRKEPAALFPSQGDHGDHLERWRDDVWRLLKACNMGGLVSLALEGEHEPRAVDRRSSFAGE